MTLPLGHTSWCNALQTCASGPSVGVRMWAAALTCFLLPVPAHHTCAVRLPHACLGGRQRVPSLLTV